MTRFAVMPDSVARRQRSNSSFGLNADLIPGGGPTKVFCLPASSQSTEASRWLLELHQLVIFTEFFPHHDYSKAVGIIKTTCVSCSNLPFRAVKASYLMVFQTCDLFRVVHI
jgi:hypothetical protein